MADTSTNLSKIQRERLLDICSRIKNKETVEVTEIAELEQFIKSMKYGLTFEKHEEPVDAMLRTHIPVFKEFKEIVNNLDSADCNFLLEGDNLHSLKLLEKTHKGAIDVIYIDPPYNTLNDDFAYGDKMLDENDGFIHSKWLSFMKERLELARKLLKDEGVIFISIDDNEQAQLKLLCDNIFGEQNFVNCLIWYYQNSTMKSSSEKLAKTHEYILVYRKTARFKPVQIRDGEVSKELLKRFGKYADEDLNIRYKAVKNEESYLSRILPKFKKEFGRDPQDDDILQTLQPNYLRDVINRPTIRSNNFKDTFGVEFNNPKNPALIKLLLRLVSDDGGASTNRNALVLDFFAGSGTTAQAVLELNKEDEGNRTFILCTNNEISAANTLEYLHKHGYMQEVKPTCKNKSIESKIDKFLEANPDVYQDLFVDNKDQYDACGICQSVTYQRIKTIITGIRPDGSKYSDGIKANLKYLQTDMIDKTDDDLDELLYEASFYLAELENMAMIDGISTCTANCDEDIDDIITNATERLKEVFIADDVLLSSQQKDFFMRHNVEIKQIPNYYYKEM